jgi:hypothetical protein
MNAAASISEYLQAGDQEVAEPLGHVLHGVFSGVFGLLLGPAAPALFFSTVEGGRH